MSGNILKRTTFVVADARAAAEFYTRVFGWPVWYDNVLAADHRFPPSGAPDKAQVHLVILEPSDPLVGKIGFLEYLDPPFEVDAPAPREKIRFGEPILVVQTEDIEGVHQRALEAGARVVTAPVDWQVPTPDGSGLIHLRTISMFDPSGIYLEISAH